MPPAIKYNVLASLLALVLCVLFFEVSNLDMAIQHHFFDPQTHHWLLDRNEPILKFILYDGMKVLLVLFALAVFVALVFFRKTKLVRNYRKGLLIVLLTAILVPSVVGELKTITNMPCPRDLSSFNGNYPHIKLFEHYPKEFHQPERMRCYPAGHASGGFALLSLFYLFKTARKRRYALLLGMGVGWSTGIYKMLIGDHFLSHTLVTMILAWLIASAMAWLVEIIDSVRRKAVDD